MRRWPPIAWIPVYIGSVLILMGGSRNTPLLVLGTALVVASFAVALWLALGPWKDRPRPRWFWWALAIGAAAYIAMAAGALAAGWQYALGAVLAGVVPLTALALVLAMYRSKTILRPEDDGHAVDASARDDADTAPGVGLGDGSPERVGRGAGPADRQAEELRDAARRARGTPEVTDEVAGLEGLKRESARR